MNTRLLQEVYNLAKAQGNLELMLKAAYALPEDIEPDDYEDTDCDDEEDEDDDFGTSEITIEDFLVFIRGLQ